MPRYAVVVCPRCKSAFIVEPGHRTVSCRGCGRRLEAARLKVLFASDDFREAQDARGAVLAGMAGDSAAFEAAAGRDATGRIGDGLEEMRYREDKRRVEERMDAAARETRKKGLEAILREAFEELARGGDFGVEEYWARVSFQGIGRPRFDRWVEKLVETGEAYSPRYGFLRKS